MPNLSSSGGAFLKGCAPFVAEIGPYNLLDRCTFPAVPSPIVEPITPPIPIPPIDEGCYALSVRGTFHGPSDPLTPPGGSVSASVAFPTDPCEPDINIEIFVPCTTSFGGTTILDVVYDPNLTDATGDVTATDTGGDCDFGLSLNLNFPCPTAIVAKSPTINAGEIPNPPSITVAFDKTFGFINSSSGITCDYDFNFQLDMPCPVDFDTTAGSISDLDVVDEDFFTGVPVGGFPSRRWAHGQPAGRINIVSSPIFLSSSTRSDCSPIFNLDLNLPCPAGGIHRNANVADPDEMALLAARQAAYVASFPGGNASLHPYYSLIPSGSIVVNQNILDFSLFGTAQLASDAAGQVGGRVERTEFNENCELDLDMSVYVPCGKRSPTVVFLDSANGTPVAGWSSQTIQDWQTINDQDCAFDEELQIYVGAAASPPGQGGRHLGLVTCDTSTDENYTLGFATLQFDAGTGSTTIVDDPTQGTVTAANLAEMQHHTHGIRVGEPVEFFEKQDQTGAIRYVFQLMPIAIMVWLGGAFSSYATTRTHNCAIWSPDDSWIPFIPAPQNNIPVMSLTRDVVIFNNELYGIGSFQIAIPNPPNPDIIIKAALARWDGSTWILITDAANPAMNGFTALVWQNKIYMGVSNTAFGMDIVSWDGTSFASTGFGATDYHATQIHKLFNSSVDGTDRLYCVGTFNHISNPGTPAAPSQAGARLVGSVWGPVPGFLEGETTSYVGYNMAEHNGELYFAGTFPAGVAKFNGTTTTLLPAGLFTSPYVGIGPGALASFNGTLYVGMRAPPEHNANGGNYVGEPLFRLSGNTWFPTIDNLRNWSRGGGGSTTIEMSASITSLVPYENKLAVAGSFTHYRSHATSAVLSGGFSQHPEFWSTPTWTSFNEPIPGIVNACVVYEGVRIVGGVFNFTSLGGQQITNIAQYDVNGNILPLGSGIGGGVKALEVHNGILYAGGSFSTAGGTIVKNIAAWDGTAWSAIGGPGQGVNGTVFDLLSVNASFPDAPGVSPPVLLIAGNFDSAGGETGGHVNLTLFDDSHPFGGPPPGAFYGIVKDIFPADGSSFISSIGFDPVTLSDVLVVGGNFSEIGKLNARVEANNIARYTIIADTWNPLEDQSGVAADNGLGLPVNSLIVSPDGGFGVSVTVISGLHDRGGSTSGTSSPIWRWQSSPGDPQFDPAGWYAPISSLGSLGNVVEWGGESLALFYDANSVNNAYVALNVYGDSTLETFTEPVERVFKIEPFFPNLNPVVFADSSGAFTGRVLGIHKNQNTAFPDTDVLACGDFISFSTIVTDNIIRVAAQDIISIDSSDKFHDIGGGTRRFSTSPPQDIGGEKGILSAKVADTSNVNSLPSTFCTNGLSILVAGGIESVSDGYSPLAVGMDQKSNYVPLRGGLLISGFSATPTRVTDFAHNPARNEVLLAGRFTGGHNKNLSDEEIANNVDEFVLSRNVVLFDGFQYKRLSTNPSYVDPKTIAGCGVTADPLTGTPTWVIVSDTSPGIISYFDYVNEWWSNHILAGPLVGFAASTLAVLNDVIYVGGVSGSSQGMVLSGSPTSVVGTTITGTANVERIRVLDAGSGPELYAAVSNNAGVGNPVYKKVGSSWVNASTNLVGSATDVTLVEHAGTIYMLVVAGELNNLFFAGNPILAAIKPVSGGAWVTIATQSFNLGTDIMQTCVDVDDFCSDALKKAVIAGEFKSGGAASPFSQNVSEYLVGSGQFVDPPELGINGFGWYLENDYFVGRATC